MSVAQVKSAALPRLVISEEDHGRLLTMANGISGSMSDVAEQLATELDRARVVADKKLPANVVRMGSTVSFTTSDGFDRTFQLVYPAEADITAGKVSVLTPIGAAMIGLKEGHTMPWAARDGRTLQLTITSVRNDPSDH